MVCKPALQHYSSPPTPIPPALPLSTRTHKYKLGTSLASLIVSVRLEEACCYTIIRQSSPWQAARQAGLSASSHPPGNKALFQVFHSTAPGSELHKLFTPLLVLGENSMSVTNNAAWKKWNSAPEDLLPFFLRAAQYNRSEM